MYLDNVYVRVVLRFISPAELSETTVQEMNPNFETQKEATGKTAFLTFKRLF